MSAPAGPTLVTGGSGILGRAVVRVLADAGHEVHSVDLPGSAAPDGAAAAPQVDLSDAAATQELISRLRPAAVVHLAGLAVPFSRPEPELLRTNVALAHHVADAAVAEGVGTVLLTSSPTVMGYGCPRGWRPEYLPLDEEHPRRPWHAYALSKCATEDMAAMYARAQDRTRFAVMRPGYVLSAEQWAGAPTQDGSTVADRLADPGLAAKSLFNYIDSRDAGEFVVRLLDSGPEDVRGGETFFVTAADPLAEGPLADLLPRHHPGLGDLAAHLGPGLPAFSPAKAERLLGWRAARSWRTEHTAPLGGTR